MGAISAMMKVAICGVVFVSLGWIMFALTIDDETLPSEKPYVMTGGRLLRPLRSPAPLMKPKPRPPYREFISEQFNLRKCECRKDWETLPADTPSICRCRGNCPSYVTPPWLTAAAGQALCHLQDHTGFNCYAECNTEEDEVKWFAEPCVLQGAGQRCDPRIAIPVPKTQAQAAVEAAASQQQQQSQDFNYREQKDEDEDNAEDAQPQQPEQQAPVPQPDPPSVPAPDALPASGGYKLDYDPNEVYDLRGLQCEELNGKEQCFYEDAQGRELCPSYVTSEWLAFPKDQYLCSSAMAHQFYCTLGCQEGNEDVRWGANEIAWCFDPKNAGACPPKPKVIPKKEWKLKPWSAPKDPETPCEAAWRKGERPKDPIPQVTFGMLTHEPRSMRDSLATYEQNGLFDVTAEFLVYVNKRTPEIDTVLKPYVDKYGSKRFKVMGDANNYGIARGINFLTGNASQPYFLFLERDFQLIEPATCVVEQVTAGLKLIKSKTADVVRYRHRKHPGRPNWAERMFRGKEDEVFKRGQPNLFCNHYYWVEQPETRWPDKMWVCNKSPQMYCSDSYYCNWTNNPQLWSIDWWNREYVARFDAFRQNDPYYDLEMYMNWEPNSWNDRGFTVAQGAGLFKHVDRGNFGT